MDKNKNLAEDGKPLVDPNCGDCRGRGWLIIVEESEIITQPDLRTTITCRCVANGYRFSKRQNKIVKFWK